MSSSNWNQWHDALLAAPKLTPNESRLAHALARLLLGWNRTTAKLGAIDGLLPCARCELEVGSSDLDPRVNSHRIMRAAVLVSGPQEASLDGFRELTEGEIVAVPRSIADVESV